MTSTANAPGTATADLESASAVLAFARDRRTMADRAEAELLEAAVSWAVMHPAESIIDAATFIESFGQTAVPVAGAGAPLVAEFSIPEFAAAVGMPTEVGKAYLGEAVELRYRLLRLWARVVAGELPAWRARRIARATLHLSVEAVCGSASGAGGAQGRTGGDRAAGRRGDRPVHA